MSVNHMGNIDCSLNNYQYHFLVCLRCFTVPYLDKDFSTCGLVISLVSTLLPKVFRKRQKPVILDFVDEPNLPRPKTTRY